ncbi:MAG: GNAT family N-acetyltransferase [Actinomycetota bacterium]|nr:GNAT family N-acetyltransferase [Actinomycetota bacterium]
MRIAELTTPAEWRGAFAVLGQLRDHLSEEAYLSTLEEMTKAGYRLLALFEDDEIVAAAGVGIGLNFYYGKYMWVYDLVTSERHRSRGHGRALLEHVEWVARAEGCETLALSSGLQRKDAHRFYEDKMGYEKASYAFKKDLTGP